MIKFRFLAAAALVAGLAYPAAAQLAPGQGAGPAPGTVDAGAFASGTRGENENYNRLIGKVGAQPVKQDKAKAAARSKPVPASAADVVPGSVVRDVKGVAFGKVESIDGDSAILAFGTGKIRYPIIGFGKDANGLLINLTTKDFLAAVAKAKSGG
ncbi:MAG: hypothetical protein ABIQ32_13390 [Sphingomicrobium sp.]